MSVITAFTLYSHCNDIGGKVWNPAIRWTYKHAVFVEIKTSDGITGLGECWCFDSQPDALIAYLKTEVAPHVLGSPVSDLPALYQRLLTRATLTARHGILSNAWSGVDIAVWDIRSRKANLPLWKFLRSKHEHLTTSNIEGIRLYGSGGLYGENKTIDDLTAEMVAIESDGFELVKMKVGGLDTSQDVARVLAVINALNDHCQLIIDGVYSYTPSQALALYNALPTDRVVAFQSPTPANDYSGMQALCNSKVPVMGTEAEYREEILNQLVSTNAVTCLQISPIAVGGISRVLYLATHMQTEKTDIQLSMEVSSTAVALLTACHLSLGIDRIAHVEYHYIHQVFFKSLDLTAATLKYRDSKLLNKIGLGIDVNELDVEPQFTLTA